MKNRTRLTLIVFLMFALLGTMLTAGCGGQAEQPAGEPAASQETPAEEESSPTVGGDGLYTPEYQPNGKEVAVLKTSKGEITVELFGEDAPIHVGNFVELVQKGFYDGTAFHRYEPGFVIQGGDPQSKGLSPDQVQQAVNTGNPPLGTGGPGYSIQAEFDPAVNPNKHVVGALGMARSQDPNSAGSQFYFALDALPMLDGQYTVFGVVTDGMDVVKELRVGDSIESVTITGAN